MNKKTFILIGIIIGITIGLTIFLPKTAKALIWYGESCTRDTDCSFKGEEFCCSNKLCTVSAAWCDLTYGCVGTSYIRPCYICIEDPGPECVPWGGSDGDGGPSGDFWTGDYRCSADGRYVEGLYCIGGYYATRNCFTATHWDVYQDCCSGSGGCDYDEYVGSRFCGADNNIWQQAISHHKYCLSSSCHDDTSTVNKMVEDCPCSCSGGSCTGCVPGTVQACGACGSQTCQLDCSWGSCAGGVCDSAIPSNNPNCPCPSDTCVGKDYYDYPSFGTCRADCTCNTSTDSGQPCQPTITPNAPRCQVTATIKVLDSSGCDVTDLALPCSKTWLKPGVYTLQFEAESSVSNLKSCDYYIFSCSPGGTDCIFKTSLTTNCSGSTTLIPKQIRAGKGEDFSLEGLGRYLISFRAKNIDEGSTFAEDKLLNFDLTPPFPEIK